jgi:hypothetical protein
MAEITATMRQLLDQIGLSTPAELTSEQATNPHNPLLQLVNDLLKEALAEAGRAERAFGRRLRLTGSRQEARRPSSWRPAPHARRGRRAPCRLANRWRCTGDRAPARQRVEGSGVDRRDSAAATRGVAPWSYIRSIVRHSVPWSRPD